MDDKDFINFTRSDNLRLIYSQTKFVTTQEDITAKFIDVSTTSTSGTMCIASFYLMSYNNNELIKLSKKYKYLSDLVDYTKKAVNMPFAFSIECFDKIFKFGDGKYCDSLSNRNALSLSTLKDCLKNKNVKIVRIHLGFLVSKSDATSDIGFDNEPIVAHSSQLILNTIENKAYILESSINDHELSQRLENIKDISTQTFLREYINKDIVLEQIDLTVCPPVKLQGETSLCATWSLYLFILVLLNPELKRNTIYKIFSEYTQHQRDVLIMMFMYWIFKFEKYKNLNLRTSLLEGDLPSL